MTRTLRVVLLGVLASLLVGCGGDPSPPASGPATTSSAAPGSPAAPTPGSSAALDSPSTPSGRTTGSTRQGGGNDDDASSGDPGGESGGDSSGGSDGESGTDPGLGLEVPEAAEQTVESLSELLDDRTTAPLVRAPLPRASSARGRLVRRFPALLRPTRGSRVETSSLSPSGPRLQVGLVGSTSAAPDEVLLAYRTRLGGRGLIELATPPATAGSQAAAFQRGRSTVTVTVTARGSGTTYAVHASLHAGGE